MTILLITLGFVLAAVILPALFLWFEVYIIWLDSKFRGWR